MVTDSSLFKFTVKLVIATLIVVVLILGKSFLIPLAWSILIGLSSFQLINKLKEKSIIPAGLIILLYIIFIISIIALIFYFFFIELSHIASDLPELRGKISASIHALSLQLGEMGVHIPDHIDKEFINQWINGHSDTILGFISGFGDTVWHIVLIMFYLFFILYYGDLAPQFIQSKVKDEKKREEIKQKTNYSIKVIKSYFIGLLILALLTGTLDYIVFLIFGLEYALFLAVLLAILNLIPFVGNPVGLLIVALFTLVTEDSLVSLLMVIVALWVVNFFHENVLRPWLLGDRLQINAFVVFMAVIVGGLIWGVSGMILFIPLAGIVKVILSNSDETAHYAILFSERKKRKSEKNKTENILLV